MALRLCALGALLASSCAALPWPPGSHHHHGGSHAEAVYFLRVDPSGSSIVAIAVEDGRLTDSTSVTSTGGVGQQSENVTATAPVSIDPLQGQQAVSIGGNVCVEVISK
jgi:hypothetical protein